MVGKPKHSGVVIQLKIALQGIYIHRRVVAPVIVVEQGVDLDVVIEVDVARFDVGILDICVDIVGLIDKSGIL